MARTIRPKIHARPDFMGAIPELSPNPEGTKLPAATDWEAAQASLDLDESVPGEKAQRNIQALFSLARCKTTARNIRIRDLSRHLGIVVEVRCRGLQRRVPRFA